MSRANFLFFRSVVTLAALVLIGPRALAGSGQFQEHQRRYQTGFNTSKVAVADLNGDGVLDLVAAGYAARGGISVLLGNTNGTFQPYVKYEGEHFSGWVRLADFNRDGKLDVAASTQISLAGGDNTCKRGESISIRLGNGDGSFQPNVTFGERCGFGDPFAVGDFNSDGKLDLVMAPWGLLSVLLGNGDGTFQPQTDYNNGVSAPTDLAAVDFNGDGKTDLVISSYMDGTVNVLLGNGNGTFQVPMKYPTGGNTCVSLAVQDFNNDGKLDVATANEYPNGVSVLLGNGDGTLQPHVDYGIEPQGNVYWVAAGDFNADGALDLAVPNGNVMSVLLNNGDGTLQEGVDYTAEFPWDFVAVGDFNGDGALDLVGTWGGVIAMFNSGGTRMQLTSSPNPAKLGEPVTFTVSVQATFEKVGTPTGTVTFTDGTTSLGTSPLAFGQASLTTSGLSEGDHKVHALYSGDDTFNRNRRHVLQQVTQSGLQATSLRNFSTESGLRFRLRSP